MSGHSKWSTIKRKKSAIDAKRAQFFSKLIRELTAAVREGGNEIATNPRLRLAIHNAKGANMPKENIERAIHKGTVAGAADFMTVTYEGNAAHGVALIIECTTDNLNRTVGNVRAIFSKYGGVLGKKGSVSFLFDRKGTFVIPQATVQDEEALSLCLSEVGAQDWEYDSAEHCYYLLSSLEHFGAVQKELERLHITVESASLRYIPHTQVELPEEDCAEVMKLLEALEENDDVQQVYHNVRMSPE